MFSVGAGCALVFVSCAGKSPALLTAPAQTCPLLQHSLTEDPGTPVAQPGATLSVFRLALWLEAFHEHISCLTQGKWTHHSAKKRPGDF